MIDNETKEKILEAARIEEVVGDFVSLRKRGANYWGLCPFHADKNPSLSVNLARNIFTCWSCGKKGNSVTFIMEHEHLSFYESLRYLAAKYHIEVKEREETPEEIAHRMHRESLLVVCDFAQKFYQDILWNDPDGQAVGLSYFRERKFSDETIRKFGLGFAPARRPSLHESAIGKGYKEEYLIDSNLCVKRDDGSLADRFYDRVMFPIHSISGRVIAFGGRTLKSDKTIAKYVNTSETEIYKKRDTLYGLFQAKNAISKEDRCILVEGYADVISMHQSGICNVVASSGTALTPGQIRLIKRFTSNIVLLYDGDEAGIHAAIRGTDMFLAEGMNLKVVILPEGADPDDFAKSHSTLEIREYIDDHSRDVIAFKCELAQRDAAADPLSRSKLINEIIRSIAVIPDPILRGEYVKDLSEKFARKEEDILSKINSLRENNRFSVPEGEPVIEPKAETPAETAADDPGELENPYLATGERELLYFLLKFGAYPIYTERDIMADTSRENLSVEDYIRNSLADDNLTFANSLFRRMYDEYFSFIANLRGANRPQETFVDLQKRTIRHFSQHDDQQILRETLDIIPEESRLNVRVFIDSLEPEETRLSDLVPKAAGLYKLDIIKQLCGEITRQISQAQHDGDKATQKELLRKLQILNKAKLAISKELGRL